MLIFPCQGWVESLKMAVKESKPILLVELQKCYTKDVTKIHTMVIADRWMTVAFKILSYFCKWKSTVAICKNIVERYKNNRKPERNQWTEISYAAPKKTKSVSSAGKDMVSVFQNSTAILLIDYLVKIQTVTETNYG